MVLVDEVWDQLGFRTPWSRGREHEEVRKALTRFVDWHHRPDARTVLATEREHARRGDPARRRSRWCCAGTPTGSRSTTTGSVVVVDLKTGKYPPTDKSLVENPQLGLYQHAVNHGALDDLDR